MGDFMDESVDNSTVGMSQTYYGGNDCKDVRIDLDKDSSANELVDVIEKIAHIDPVEKTPFINISDQWGSDQKHHIDHICYDTLAPDFQKLGFVDKNKHSAEGVDRRFVVPTFSYVVY